MTCINIKEQEIEGKMILEKNNLFEIVNNVKNNECKSEYFYSSKKNIRKEFDLKEIENKLIGVQTENKERNTKEINQSRILKCLAPLKNDTMLRLGKDYRKKIYQYLKYYEVNKIIKNILL